MKKCLSIILVLSLLLVVIPMSVQAASNDLEREELIEKACEAFPEFATKIRNEEPKPASYRMSGESEVVYAETRAVSDRELISYTEYSDGAVLLAQTQCETIYNSTTDIANEIKVDITVKATHNDAPGYFKASHVQFTINETGYDYITSPGSTSTSGGCQYGGGYSMKKTETASGDAYVKYNLGFKFGPASDDYYTTQLWIQVGSNRLSVEHIEW